MAAPELPEHVARFIRSDIHSVLQLEILLLVRERRGEWTPAAVARELRVTDESAELHLRDLSLRGLLSYSTAARSYGYAETATERSRLVDDLAACYAATRYTVINTIFSQPGDSARSLAEAFRFRRKRDD